MIYNKRFSVLLIGELVCRSLVAFGQPAAHPLLGTGMVSDGTGVGACCLDRGGCSDVALQDCIGDFQGIGTSCKELSCPPTQACCFNDECTYLTPHACLFQGGQMLPSGYSCVPKDPGSKNLVCPGACCDASGDCVDGITASSCEERFDGLFYGFGTRCGDYCPQAAACCFGGGCRLLTELGCEQQGGVFMGNGVTCVDADACPGACCVYHSTSCVDGLSGWRCEQDFEGDFQGPHTKCSDQHTCTSMTGRCCVSSPETPCRQGLTEIECTSAGGIFSVGEICGLNACPTNACPGEGDCCIEHRNRGCEDSECCLSVCQMDPYCCLGNSWDGACVSMASDVCNTGPAPYCGGCRGFVSTTPNNCTIDARKPAITDNAPGNTTTAISLVFSQGCDVENMRAQDFEVICDPLLGACSTLTLKHAAPPVLDVELTIPSGVQWSCLRHRDSGDTVCIGNLPGDVNNDGRVNPVDWIDLLWFVEHHYPASMSLYQCDIDGNGKCNAMDIYVLVDMINGAYGYSWSGQSIGTCPLP